MLSRVGVFSESEGTTATGTGTGMSTTAEECGWAGFDRKWKCEENGTLRVVELLLNPPA